MPKDGGNVSHQHDFEPIPDLDPIFEDWAAIFHERCYYAPIISSVHSEELDESFHEYGEECGEERSIRMDLQEIQLTPFEGKPPISIDQSEFERFNEMVESWVQRIESAEKGAIEFLEVNPDPEDGQVVARVEPYDYIYEP